MHKDHSKEFYPLSHPQKRIWYVENAYPDTSLHNIGGYAKINGKVDFELLEESIEIFINKNEAVRLRLKEENGEIKQYVCQNPHYRIDFLDFSKYSNPEEEFQAWVRTEFEKGIKLEEDNLFYFALYRVNDAFNGYLAKLHHIISDGWSINIMTEQLCDTYTRLMNDMEVGGESENSYLEYLDSENRYISSERFIKNKRFWNEKFNTLPELMNKTSSNIKGKRKTFVLDDEFSDSIKVFIGKERISLNTFFISVLLASLHKIEQKDDIVIGSPVLNRSGKKEKSMIGMFTSTMPFRFCIDSNSTVSDFIGEVNREIMQCYFSQKYPYDFLASDLELKRKGYDSLFQVCVNYYNTHLSKEINGISVESVEVYNGCQLYSLQLVIKDWTDTGKLTLDFDYKTDDYSEFQIESMYSIVMNITRQFITNPDMRIKDVEILSKKDKDCLIYELNDTGAVYPGEKTIYGLFEEQVKKTPDRIAVAYEDLQLTYRELNEKANQLAGMLRRKGVKPDGIIALMVTHSLEAVIGILGVLKSGGAYLPVDPSYPAERANYLLEDSGAKILLTNTDLKDGMEFNGEIINIGDKEIYCGTTNNIEAVNSPNDLAYVIYTSGSTGKPKGVMIEHRGLVNYIWWAKRMYIPKEDEIFALYSSLSFDLTVTSVFTPLICGSKIEIYSDDGSEFILYKILRENRVTVVKLTPAHLSLLKDMDNSNSSVKRFIVGGEDLKTGLANSIHKSFNGKIEIFNEYGPTETVVGCMIHKYDPEKDTGGSVPIGHPASNVQIYILDRFLNPLPGGTIGEMYISGDGVARGYLNRQQLTDERFICNPFIAGQKMYKTGDLARRLDDGKIEYSGRADHQVKIRGYRIELGEIESQLMRHESIEEAVVIDCTDSTGSKFLCAYVVPGNDFNISGIREFLSRYLPDYMVPLHFIAMEQLPLTVNGKVNRDSLPAPVSIAGDERPVIYKNESEEKVAEVFRQILGVDRMGASDNFYHFGGDSIKAIQVAARLGEMGLGVKVKDVMANPSIEQLAVIAGKGKRASAATQAPCEGSVGRMPIISWFFAQNFKNINYWNQSVFLTLKQDIGTIEIKNAVNAIIRHHDSLRLNYDAGRAELFYNNKHLTEEYEVQEFNLSAFTPDEQQVWIARYSEQIKASMDIENGVLFRAGVFITGHTQNRKLLLTAHHIVTDGVSWRIMLEDFDRLLRCGNASNTELLPAKTCSMKVWAEQLGQYSLKSVLKEREYWDSVIKDVFAFPIDFNTGDDSLEYCDIVTGSLCEKETEALLKNANNAYGTKPDELLVAALAHTVESLTGMKDIVIELEGHGREDIFEDIDVSRTVGWFTSIYPVRLRMNETDMDLQIKSLKEQIRGIPNKGIGFGILKYLNGILRYDGQKHIRFNYLGDFKNISSSSVFEVSNGITGSDCCKSNHMTCRLDINAMVFEDKLEISITYSKNKYTGETVQKFIDTFIERIREIISYCCSKDQVEFTPSDFDTIEISQNELDNMFA
ncbi:MAG: amino acid adenylation domain-containing protein [Clostridia bacterium]|nr:amino acid adenylation domain-containing protein [Clostridia bacterium]